MQHKTDYKIVFSDVDGTLLNSRHELSVHTKSAIESLQKKGIPFVIISARSPSGIYPIQKTYQFKSPIICYSGAMILDENRNVLYEKGFSRALAKEIAAYIEENRLPCAWNVYAGDTWMVKDKKDPRVIREETIVQAEAVEGTVDALPEQAQIGKILCMCAPNSLLEIEQKLKAAFPMLSIVKSSDTLLEIMQSGITKSIGVKELCKLWGISPENAVAFGDHYNDIEMLETVGAPFLMGNAPESLRKLKFHITDSNDKDGIYTALKKIGLI